DIERSAQSVTSLVQGSHVQDAVFAPDGRLVTAGRDGAVRSWETVRGTLTWARARDRIVQNLGFDRTAAVFFRRNGDRLELWDATTGALRRSLRNDELLGSTRPSRSSADRLVVKFEGQDGRSGVHVLDVATDRWIATYLARENFDLGAPGSVGPGLEHRRVEGGPLSPGGRFLVLKTTNYPRPLPRLPTPAILPQTCRPYI